MKRAVTGEKRLLQPSQSWKVTTFVTLGNNSRRRSAITSHVFIQIRLEPSWETVSSPLPSCAVERPQRSSWPWFVDRQTTHILVHNSIYHMQRIYQYIPVYTSMYCFIPHHTHVFLRIWACLSTRRYRSVCRLSYRHSQVVSFLRIPTCNELCYPMYWYMGLIKSLWAITRWYP